MRRCRTEDSALELGDSQVPLPRFKVLLPKLCVELNSLGLAAGPHSACLCLIKGDVQRQTV